VSLGTAPTKRPLALTLRGREALEVNGEGDVVLKLGRRLGKNVASVLLLEVLAGAVLEEIGPALDRHGQNYHRLGLGCRDVEAHRVKVDKLNVCTRRPRVRGVSGIYYTSLAVCAAGGHGDETYFWKRSERTSLMMTLWDSGVVSWLCRMDWNWVPA
jgi:hypothetical protein